MRIGSLVICIDGGLWEDEITKELKPGPNKDDILTVAGFQDGKYLIFEEYPQIDWDGRPIAYNERNFRELQPPLDIKTLIEEEQTA